MFKRQFVRVGVIVAVVALLPAAGFAQNGFTIGANFTGSTLFSQSGFIPPDTDGAVGPSHFVELINGTFRVYSKAGTPLQTKSLNTFWTDAGATPSGSFAFDPRVLYDPFSGRWFASSADNAGGNNNFLVAVSSSSDPTGAWTGFKIDSDSGNTHWADFPTLGINSNGVYLAANMFPITSGPVDVTLLVLPKADLIAGSIANRTLLEHRDPNTTGYTLQPVVNMDNGALPHLVLSDYNTPAGFFKRSNFTSLGPPATLNTNDQFIAVPAFSAPPTADQPGTKQNLDAGDDRFPSSVIVQNGNIWGVQGVNSGGRAAVRWFRIDVASNTLAESGLISDPSLAYFYPSIAVNDFGDVVIGFSGTSPSQFASSYAAVGRFNGVSTTFNSPSLLKAGVSDYFQDFGGGVNRWGDYSATTLDPSNPLRFWTIQEWVSSTDVWSTQITELIVVPEIGPVSLVALAMALFGYRVRRVRR